MSASAARVQAVPGWLDHARAGQVVDVLLGRLAPEHVRKRDNPLDKAGFDRTVRAVALRLLEATARPEATAARGLRDALDVNWSALSPSARERALGRAEALLGRLASQVGPPLRAILREEGRAIVAASKGAAIGRYELPIAAAFGKQDERVVEHAATSQSLFVTDHYGKRSEDLSRRAREVVADGLDKGLDRYEIGKELQSTIGDVLGRSASYYPMLASVFAARARTWSVLSSFEEAGIETWEFSAVLDEATCFAAGTRVLLGDGSTWTPIDKIQVGHVVMSCKGRPRRVLGIVRQPSRKWGELVLDVPDAGPLVLTQSHGMLTAKGWVRAQTLGPHDRVALWTPDGPSATSRLWSEERAWGMRRGRHESRTLDVAPWPHPELERFGRFAGVRSIVWTATGRSEDAYDLEVQEDEGYIAEGVVVHNSHICRYLDGRVFSVEKAISRYREVAANDDPEYVRTAQPFVRESGGLLYVGAKSGEGHFPIARVEESAMGKRDERGTFSGGAEPGAVEAKGVSAPPLHPFCRSELIPKGYSSKPVSVPAQIAPQPPSVETPPPGKIVPVEPGLTTQPVVVGPAATPEQIAPLVRPTRAPQGLPADFNPEALPVLPPEQIALLRAAAAKQKAIAAAMDKVDALPKIPGYLGAEFKAHGLPSLTDEQLVDLPVANGVKMAGAKKQKPKPGSIADMTLQDPHVSGPSLKEAIVNYDPAKPIIVLKQQGKLVVHGDSAYDYIAAKMHGASSIPTQTIDFDKVPKPKKPKAEPPPPPPVPSPPPPSADAAVILAHKISEQKGSNPGGIYRGSDGVERYVKFYDDPAKAASEHLANTVYRDLGLASPESVLFEHEGRIAYASKIIPGAHTLREVGQSAERSKKILEGFVADVLTGNWDAVGLGQDNVMFDAAGTPIRIDSGGTFLFRATAGRKPTSALNAITEWEFFFSGNRQYAEMAAQAGVHGARDMKDEVLAGIDRVTALQKAGGGWGAYVDRMGLPFDRADRNAVVAMLDARTQLLSAKAEEMRRVRAPSPPGSSTPFSFHTPDGERLFKKIKDMEYDVPKGLYDRSYRAGGMTEQEQSVAKTTVSGWTGEYRNGSIHQRLYAAAGELMTGKAAPPSSEHAAIKKAYESRRSRWRAVLDELGLSDVPVPESFEVWRGVKGDIWIDDVAKAWAAGAEKVTVRSDPLASWSMLKGKTVENFAFGGGGQDGVMHRWNAPMEHTVLDQVVDDHSFVSTFNHEHEVIAGTGHDGGVDVNASDAEVMFNGKRYTYDNRAELIAALKKRGRL